jgi:hypothetical protein
MGVRLLVVDMVTMLGDGTVPGGGGGGGRVVGGTSDRPGALLVFEVVVVELVDVVVVKLVVVFPAPLVCREQAEGSVRAPESGLGRRVLAQSAPVRGVVA